MGLTKSNYYKQKARSSMFETSWDDGGSKDVMIADLLSKYNLSGTFYVVIDYIGKDGYMSWDQIKQLDKRGFTIGSHTVTHPQDLKKLHDEDLFYEIQNSKDMIETVLGHKITKFCYPRGRTDERVKEVVARAGYLEARGTGKPGITSKKDRLYLPGTIHVYQREEYGDLSIFDYAQSVIDRVAKEGGYCNVWGHSAEIDRDNTWGTLEKILAYINRMTV